MAKHVTDVCRLCGLDRDMTFEHVPPRAAYNADRAEVFTIADWLGRDQGGMDKGRIQQRGSGYDALCEDCNNLTGRWYVRELAGWVRRGLSALHEYDGHGMLDADPLPRGVSLGFDAVRPLLFLKEVVSMLLTINGPEFGEANPDLRDFVLDRARRGLPERYRFYLTLFEGPSARYVGLTGKANLSTGQSLVVTELAYPPFAYSLVIGEPLRGLPTADISRYAFARPDHQLDVELDLLVGYGHTPLPLDFRSQAAIDSGMDWSHMERVDPPETAQ